MVGQQHVQVDGKTLVQREIDLVIDSDTSQEGWGVCCSRCPNSQQEHLMHINSLKLLAASLAANFCKVQDSNIHPAENLQHPSSCLHQQSGPGNW